MVDCPICLEKEPELFKLSCNHYVHLECLRLCFKLECPLCRAVPTNLPTDVSSQINENNLKYKKEMEEEERQNIIENLMTQNEIFITPQQEAFLAISYLRAIFIENRLPMYFIPTECIIDYYDMNFDTPIGYFFNYIVSEVMFRLNDDILNSVSSEEYESSENSEYEFFIDD